ncbi:helix-turn-helix domain-containing protein [Rhizobium halophytocola]|uniref:Transcriptional regulator with XRE-family HTH domain n=1 Tax=Rhizobium halophytocola TaxID=735519 RepID=A0ABS4DT07_9HYPH|nr:helix-turn-helix domain-containing protein [Rhizobium halophytocola]MBP1848832.1 transcriptional regulator with XRE-family HTH domain [Rhizobium halophytocola]
MMDHSGSDRADLSRGSRLRKAMSEKGYAKQHAFAVALDVSESTVTRWLANGPMSLDSAADICLTFNISLDWLVLGRGEMRPLPEAAKRVIPEAPSIVTFARLYKALPPKSRELLDSFMQSLSA